MPDTNLEDFLGDHFEEPKEQPSSEETTKQDTVVVEEQPLVESQVEATTEPENQDSPNIELDEDYEGEPIEQVENAVDSFLSLYGVNSKEIKFINEEGNEESTTWEELNPQEQFEYLSSLTESNIELDDEETAFLNAVRESNMSPTEYIEALQQQNSGQQGNQFVNTSELSDEDVFAIDYRINVDDSATDEEILDEFERIKDTKSFGKRVSKMREGIEQQQAAEYEQELEQQREEILEKVVGINNILGDNEQGEMVLDDTRKNHILNKMLNVDESGNSEFVNEYFSNPEKLYKAVAMVEFGEEYINQLHHYYKQQLIKSKEEGRKEVLGTLPDKPLEKETSDDNKNKVIKAKTPAKKTLADLHSTI